MTGTRVGWIGTGVMGAPMCGHLLASGYPVTVFNRTPERARGLLERGAAWAESPQAVAQHADVVFTMVGFPDDVREIVLGPAGTLAGAGHGTILVDMTTSEPSLAREIYEAARARGVASLDAPVSGGDVGGGAADAPLAAGPRPGGAALSRARRAGRRPRGHACPRARAREALGRGVAGYTFSTSAAALSAPTAAGTPA